MKHVYNTMNVQAIRNMSIIKLCFKPRSVVLEKFHEEQECSCCIDKNSNHHCNRKKTILWKYFLSNFLFLLISHKKLGLIGLIFVKVANRGKGGNFQIKKWYVDFCSFFFEKKETIFKIILISYSTCPLNCLKYCSRRALDFDLQEVFGLFNSLLRKNFLQFLRKILCSGCLC